jgi:ABC-type lipoprotein export system ATPase subunit
MIRTLFFADEPTGNLDSKTGDAIMNLFLGLARERKKGAPCCHSR